MSPGPFAYNPVKPDFKPLQKRRSYSEKKEFVDNA